MPSHGTETIDGIPVIIRDGVLLAFQPGAPTGTPPIRLGSYDSKTKKHTWELQSPALSTWLNDYRQTIQPRTRATAVPAKSKS